MNEFAENGGYYSTTYLATPHLEKTRKEIKPSKETTVLNPYDNRIKIISELL